MPWDGHETKGFPTTECTSAAWVGSTGTLLFPRIHFRVCLSGRRADSSMLKHGACQPQRPRYHSCTAASDGQRPHPTNCTPAFAEQRPAVPKRRAETSPAPLCATEGGRKREREGEIPPTHAPSQRAASPPDTPALLGSSHRCPPQVVWTPDRRHPAAQRRQQRCRTSSMHVPSRRATPARRSATARFLPPMPTTKWSGHRIEHLLQRKTSGQDAARRPGTLFVEIHPSLIFSQNMVISVVFPSGTGDGNTRQHRLSGGHASH